jgi:hypothetical protein
VTAWRDASAGTLANALLLLAVAYAFLTDGPWSFRAQFDRDVLAGLSRAVAAPVVTESEVDRLPELTNARICRFFVGAWRILRDPTHRASHARRKGRRRGG